MYKNRCNSVRVQFHVYHVETRMQKMYGHKNCKNRERQKKENNLLVGKKQREKGYRGRKGDKIIYVEHRKGIQIEREKYMYIVYIQIERNVRRQREMYVHRQREIDIDREKYKQKNSDK